MSKFGLVNDLSILLAARRLLWTAQEPGSGAPASAAAGVTLRNAPVAGVAVDLRHDVSCRTDRITVETFDATATYTVTVDTETVAYDASLDAPADVAALLEGWAAALNGDADLSALVTASVEDGALVLRGVAETTYALALATTGSAVLSLEAEPVAAWVRLWTRSRPAEGDPSPTWRALGPAFEIGPGGWEDLLRVSARDRLYVEVVATDAPSSDSVSAPHTATYLPARIRIGPAILEAT